MTFGPRVRKHPSSRRGQVHRPVPIEEENIKKGRKTVKNAKETIRYREETVKMKSKNPKSVEEGGNVKGKRKKAWSKTFWHILRGGGGGFSFRKGRRCTVWFFCKNVK
jgi:hypothetical protein